MQDKYIWHCCWDTSFSITIDIMSILVLLWQLNWRIAIVWLWRALVLPRAFGCFSWSRKSRKCVPENSIHSLWKFCRFKLEPAPFVEKDGEIGSKRITKVSLTLLSNHRLSNKWTWLLLQPSSRPVLKPMFGSIKSARWLLKLYVCIVLDCLYHIFMAFKDCKY